MYKKNKKKLVFLLKTYLLDLVLFFVLIRISLLFSWNLILIFFFKKWLIFFFLKLLFYFIEKYKDIYLKKKYIYKFYLKKIFKLIPFTFTLLLLMNIVYFLLCFLKKKLILNVYKNEKI